jgi:hypothetical protein
MTMKERLSIPLPKQMRTLEKDSRSYPIPYIVLRDASRRPQFTINDREKMRNCATRRLCAICGRRLERLVWFVGGSRCFLHPNGAFLDPPLHHACGHYALRVCPFLATRYTGRIDTRLLADENVPEGMATVRLDNMQPDQPERFGFGAAERYELVPRGSGELLFIVRDWRFIEFWQRGQPINSPDAMPADASMPSKPREQQKCA